MQKLSCITLGFNEAAGCGFSPAFSEIILTKCFNLLLLHSSDVFFSVHIFYITLSFIICQSN